MHRVRVLLAALLLLIPALVPAQTRISSPGGAGGGGGGGVTSLTGTANQVIVSGPTGAVTLSTPQNIATTSTPTFGSLTLNGPLTSTAGNSSFTSTSGATVTINTGPVTPTASDTSIKFPYTDGDNKGVRALTLQSSDALRGPFVLNVQGTLHSGTVDNVMYLGYNKGLIVPTEPSLHISMESDFNDGANRLMEWHIEGQFTDSTAYRSYGVSINRTTKVMNHAFNYDVINFVQRSTGTTLLNMNGSDFGLGSGVVLRKANNNQSFLKQLNAAGSANVDVINLNASDVIIIGQDGQSLKVSVPVGTSVGTRAKLGGSLHASTTQVNNGTTVETNLWSQTIAASVLGTNLDALHFYYAGTIQTSINNKQLKVKFGATTCFDSTAQNPVAATTFVIHGRIIRTGAATQKCSAEMSTTAGNLFTFTGYAVPAETLSGTVALVLTGQGGASNELTFEMGQIRWEPAP